MSAIYKEGFWYGGKGTGHSIKSDGTDLTQREALNFVDLDLSDDSANDETKIKAHRLTGEELADIYSDVPISVPVNVVVDERGLEYVIGVYKDTNGNIKPVYKKEISFGALPNNTSKTVAHNITNFGICLNIYGFSYSSSGSLTIPYPHPTATNNINVVIDGANVKVTTGSNRSSFTTTYITIIYTKMV